MHDWIELPFKDIIKNGNVSYGIVQPGSNDVSENSIPILRINNFKNRRLVINDIFYVHKDIECKYARTRLNGSELLITVVGTIGQCIVAPQKLKGWNVARAIAVAQVKDNFNKYFIASQFEDEYIKFQIYGSMNDTVQPTLNLKELKEIKFRIPPLAEQRAIAGVLGSLDDKIDLLQRQNSTLEAMAETLFRQWFIEEAQEGWEEKTIGDVVEIRGGGTPSTKEPSYWNGNIFWTSPRDLAGLKSIFLSSTERKITPQGLSKISSGLLPAGTLLLSSRAPIGYLAISDIDVAINQGYIAILNNDIISNYYMYLWCKYYMEEIKAAGNGSVFQEISKSVFKKLHFILPPETVLKEFYKNVDSIFKKIHANQNQIRTLEKLRDTLLPKLMSGEVRVRVDG